MNENNHNEKKETKLQRQLGLALKKYGGRGELAEHLGISQPYLSDLLSGKKTGKRKLIDFAQKLGISPLELMDVVTTVPAEELARDDRIPVYRATEFMKAYATGGMVRDKLPDWAERPGEGEGMDTSESERERRVGILIENNTYQPAFNEGDVVIVDPDEQPQVGDLCLIILGEDLLIRRLLQADDDQTTYALPSDEFRQEMIKSSSPVRMEIWGKATHFRRNL